MNIEDNLSIRTQRQTVRDGESIKVTLYSYATVAPSMDDVRVTLKTDNVAVAGSKTLGDIMEDADVLGAGGTIEPSTVDFEIPVELVDKTDGGSAVAVLTYDASPVDEDVVKVKPEK